MPTIENLSEYTHTLPTGEEMKILRWLERGDGVAVYENQDFGHPDLGHLQFVSYGSPAAQLETDVPPQRLPDIGNAINWRYQLVFTYRGEPV